jgi:hypothetical protein
MNDPKEVFNVSEAFSYDDDNLPTDTFPMKYRNIAKVQKKDKALLQKLLSHDDYQEIPFRVGDKHHNLICQIGKIVIPKSVQKWPINCYHEMLCHPGET